jgi:hypothetical protein
MNHQRAIAWHGFGDALNVCLLDSSVERQHTIMDFRIDNGTKLNDEG